ncbi:MMPL family transporter [Kineosporia sp. R_H_3]|uniref:MMPL family transporter n=1 Tax=Kineosporia sp. R_H_3 TaxID=1961848 RepID=UPI000B4B2329|nr:MMPL family transporter [Kineosporia sp. R_H_3]
MTRLLDRYGRWAARRPWYAVLAFLLLAVALNGAGAVWGAAAHDEYEVPGLKSVDGLELLRDHDPLTAAAGAKVVVHVDDGTLPPDAVTRLGDRLADVPHVAAVAPPRIASDGRTALLAVRYDGAVTDPGIFKAVEPLEEAVAPLRAEGLTVELGGEVPESAAQQVEGIGEAVGIVAALVILVLAFGSVVAAGLPVAVALSGLVAGSGGIALLAAVTDVSTIAPTVASLVGLGVGIDYALLVVVRHVDLLRQGVDPVTAAGRALATAGRSVVTAAGTVLVSLLGLRLAGISTFDSFGFATAITVVLVAAACLTLVPALSAVAGRRLLPRADRRPHHVPRRQHATPWTTRWALAVVRRPLAWALPALALMLLLAAPLTTMRMWPQDAGSNPAGSTTRAAHDLIGDAFGAGANAPLFVVVDRTAAGWSAAREAEVTRVLTTDARLAGSAPALPSPDGAVATFLAEPRFAADDARSPDLVDDLRAALPAGVHVTGATPMFHDLDTRLAARLPWVVLFVVAVSMLFLTAAFRSVVIAVKAALLNLLSVSAAYGVLTAVFQHGHGAQVLGVDHAVPVSSWVPVLLFAILFGLSMDYEVFLLSRIREDRLVTGDDRGSVVRGLASTTRVISAGAGIMVMVALGFALEPDVVVKQMGVGLAAAVLLDATVVRLVLVPATMTLLGRYAWWLPAWLDRVLPQVEADVPDDLPTVPRREPVVAAR